METNQGPVGPTFAPTPYVWLTHKRTTHPGTAFPIHDCTLLEYIGVEWCARIPEREHLRYMTQVFDTLAAAGNDDAARRAFQVLFEVYRTSEFERRFIIRSYPYGGYGKYVPVLALEEPCATYAAEIRRELQYEFLEFIRGRFWSMPVASEDPKEVIRDALASPHLLLLETRKEMARVVIDMWTGIMGDRNDELAWSILCGMILPGIGVCPNTARGVANKQVVDYILEQLRVSFRNRVEWSRGSASTLAIEHSEKWEHWMTIMGTQTPAVLLDMLAKTRASVIGWRGALEDIRARKALAGNLPPIVVPSDIAEATAQQL